MGFYTDWPSFADILAHFPAIHNEYYQIWIIWVEQRVFP